MIVDLMLIHPLIVVNGADTGNYPSLAFLLLSKISNSFIYRVTHSQLWHTFPQETSQFQLNTS